MSAQLIWRGKSQINRGSANSWCSTLAQYRNLLETGHLTKSLWAGKLVHQQLVKNHYGFDASERGQCVSMAISHLLEKLTRLYIVCNESDVAWKLFDGISEKPRNVVTWNLLIRSCVSNGRFDESVDLYYSMLELNIVPNRFTFPFVLKACSALRAVGAGREIHLHAKRALLNADVHISTALIDLYAKCGCLSDAQKVFDEMPRKDVVAWNSMVAGFSLYGDHCEESIRLFAEMQHHERPNSSSIVAVLPAVSQANELVRGKEIHGLCIRMGFDANVVVETALLDMYGKCHILSYAKNIFQLMGSRKNDVTWSSMIGSYVESGMIQEALGLFHLMRSSALHNGEVAIPSAIIISIMLHAYADISDLRAGTALHCFALRLGSLLDIKVCNTLVSMYAKCGIIDDSLKFFHEMSFKDTVSYGAIISGCVQNGNAWEALRAFHRMQFSGSNPDLATMVSVLPACSSVAALTYGSCIHCYTILSGFASNTTVCNALVDMYAKCGKINTARQVFEMMARRDVVSWNTMLTSYGIHGQGREALSLFDRMQLEKIMPDDITFLSLLSACSHSGLTQEGCRLFNLMGGIVPRLEHWTCMIDLLARAGCFLEVQDFIEKMPVEPDVHMWSSLLAACRVHKNAELGERVWKMIQRAGPDCSANFVLSSNMYSSIGRYDDAEQVRIAQRDGGFKKRPGCSWIEMGGGVVHGFVGGDRSHPQFGLIVRKIDDLLREMKRLGYSPDSSYVLQDVEEEEREQSLLYHSEKLAIAYGIISLNKNSPIVVTKNLRVCGDCHTAMKFISLIIKREITIRDATRFHCFRDGLCNCRDFW